MRSPSSKFSLKVETLAEPSVSPMSISTLAPSPSSRRSSESPGMAREPPERITSPVIAASPTFSFGS